MGTIQKLQRLSETGDITIEGIQENNEYWYLLKYYDPVENMNIDSYMPTLKQAIDSVYRGLEVYTMKINMG